MSLTNMFIINSVISIVALCYMLYKANKKIQELRVVAMTKLELLRKYEDSQRKLLLSERENKELSESLNFIKEANEQHKANAKDLYASISDWAKRYAELESQLEDIKKRQARRRERELKKSVQRQNDAIKQAMKKEEERKAKIQARKKALKPQGAVHNPVKK